jgi:hypothetical protein
MVQDVTRRGTDQPVIEIIYGTVTGIDLFIELGSGEILFHRSHQGTFVVPLCES